MESKALLFSLNIMVCLFSLSLNPCESVYKSKEKSSVVKCWAYMVLKLCFLGFNFIVVYLFIYWTHVQVQKRPPFGGLKSLIAR